MMPDRAQAQPQREIVRISRSGEIAAADDMRSKSPAERIEVMWQLALDAWAFMGEPVSEPRLPRHVTRVLRGGR